MVPVVSTIIVTVVTTFLMTLFDPKITQLCNFIRRKPYETTVIMGLGILIAISLYGTFL